MGTFTQIRYQLVFGSKYRTSFLTSENKDELFKYIFGVLREKKCHPFIVGGYANHIHCISSLHETVCLSDLIKDIKVSSHLWMDSQGDLFRNFPGWQVGYGAFTYHKEATSNLINYVKTQEAHHRKKSFEEETEDLLREHGIEYDPKYLWT